MHDRNDRLGCDFWGLRGNRKHVADSRIEWFTNRPTALLAEADAIAAESPIFNVQHTLRSVWDDSRAAYLLKAKSEAAVNA